MKKTLKSLLIMILAILIVGGLCACKSDDSNTNDKNSGSNATVDHDVIYSPQVETSLVLGEGIGEDSIRLIRSTYLKQTGKNIKLVSFDSKQETHEIVIGETSREISRKAYRFLELMDRADENVGYVIYSDGKSIAIAFDDVEYGIRAALTEAVEIFVSNYMTSPSLECKAGILVKRSFDSVDWQSQRDEARLEALWELKTEQISNMYENDSDLAEQTLEELKNLRNLYSNDYKVVEWLANLYDPVTGGFYYSNSARNNEGYLPDLESTASAISLVKSILADYGGTLTDYFGEEIANRFVSFANDMQSAENGYFYHPQWPISAIDKNTTRRSRDLMDALKLLSDFNAIPKYDTPNGVKGQCSLGSVVATSALTMPLSNNNANAAVSAINSEDDIYIPPHLLSYDNFKNYLSSLNSGTLINSVQSLNAQMSQILYRDEQLEADGENYKLADCLSNWLNSKRNSKTGLWGNSTTLDVDTLNILYEVSSIYNKLGERISKVDLLIDKFDSLLVIKDEDEADYTDVNTLSTAWVALSAISENLNMFSETSYESRTCLKRIYMLLPTMLESTRLRLVKIINDDGSFKTSEKTENGMSNGMPIAVAMSDEGNVSATLAAIKTTWYAIFRTMGIGAVPVFMSADRMMFSKTLLDMGVIVKNEAVERAPVDFGEDDEDTSAGLDNFKLNLSSTNSASIVKDNEVHGNVLSIKSTSSSTTNDTIDMSPISTVTSPSCIIAELDICVLPGSSNGDVLRIFLYKNLYLMSINVSGSTVRVHEDSYQYDASYKHDLGIRAAVGEWFNIRVEYYTGTRDTVRTKVFFNDECIAVTNHFYAKHDATFSPQSSMSYLRLETVKSKNANILVDNILAESTYKFYVPETSSSLVRNADASVGNKVVHDFETAPIGSIPNGFVHSGGSSGVVSVDGNRELSISSGVTELKLPLDERGTLTNSAVVEFDAIVDENSEVGAYFIVSFNEYQLNNAKLLGFRFIVQKDSLGKYLTLAEDLSGEEGEKYDNVRIPLGENFKFRAHLFINEQLALLMINDAVVGLNNKVKSGFEKCYMGEVALSSSDKEATMLIDNLVCERIVSDYESYSVPSVERETHEFDSIDGYKSSGVSVSGGAISFESASGNPYISIPVNPRSGAVMTGSVFLDIHKIGVSINDLIISLTDNKGNKIVSFALSTDENSVGLYEYTENGKYPISIYSVNASDFTLGIEYDIINKDCNVLIDGEYVASTSLLYTPNSGNYEFEQLLVSASGAAKFLVDNAVVETSLVLFTTPTYKVQNKDDIDEIVTYEYSSFANMPTVRYKTQYFATSAAKIRIVERLIKGKVSKVLEYTSGKEAKDLLMIGKLTKPLDGANAVAFQTDLMISAESPSLNFTISLRASSGITGITCAFNVWSKDGKIMINSSNLKTKDVYLDIEDGEWFNIRCEYADAEYDYNYDGINDVVVRVYINDLLVASGTTPTNYSAIPKATSVTEARLEVAAGHYGKVYLDNTLFEQFNMSYDPPIPPDTDTLTFEPDVINNSVKATTKKGSSLSIVDMTVEGQVSKVLQYISVAEASDKLDIFVTQTLEGANAISFETDIMISPVSDKAQITLEPLNVNERQPFSLIITAEKNGNVKLYAKGIPEIVIGNSEEWIHLKIEYMNPDLDYDDDGDRDILVKIYVGESSTPKAIGYTPYSSMSYYSPSKIDKFRFSIGADTETDIYLDNTKLWQVNLVPDEGGKVPIEKDDEHFGDNELDEDGWE